MADVGVTLGIDAKELYQELQNVTAKFVTFSQQVQQAGQTAGAGFSANAAGGITDFSSQATQAGNSLAGTFGNLGSVFQRGLAALGVGLSVKGLLEYGEKIQDLSDRFGVSTHALQIFGNAAEKNGSSLEGVAKGFKALEIARSKALGGGEDNPFAKAFQELGVSVNQLNTLNPEELMLALGRSSLSAADAVKLLGKDALALRPTISGLADGTIDFGKALDSIDIARLKQGEDVFKSLGQNITILGGTVLSSFVSAWQQGINSIISLFEALGTSVAANVGGINQILHGDLSGGAHTIAEGVRAAVERVKQGGETNKEIREGPNAGGEQKKRSFAFEEAGGDAGETDDQGRALKGSGKAESATARDRARDEKDEFENRLASLSPEERINTLREKATSLLGASEAGYPELGSAEEDKKLDLKHEYYEVIKQIRAEEKKLADEKDKQAEKDDRDKDKADRAAKQNEAALASAKETTEQMERRAAGDEAGAKQAEIRAKYEKEISAALDRKNPNEPLAEELKKQEGIALHEANVNEASKSPAERQQEEQRRRESQQKHSLAEAIAKDEEDRRARGAYDQSSGGPRGDNAIRDARGNITGYRRDQDRKDGLTATGLDPALSDEDFHAQFQRKGLGLGSSDDFHKQFQPIGLTRADEVKRAQVGKEAEHKPAEKLDTAADKLGKVAEKLDSALHI